MKATRDAVTSPLREAAFAGKKPVDPTPVVDVIDNILAGPAGQRDPVCPHGVEGGRRGRRGHSGRLHRVAVSAVGQSEDEDDAGRPDLHAGRV